MPSAELRGDRSTPLVAMTMIGLLEWAATQEPTRVAIKQPKWGNIPERAWTYAEFLVDVRRLATFLSRHFQYGDHIAIQAPNSAHWFLYQFAASHLGCVLVALNPAMRQHEVEYALLKSKATGIILDKEYRGTDLISNLEAVRPNLPLLLQILHLKDWQQHILEGVGELPLSPTQPSDPALIVFTSGTTGKPKATMLHQSGCVNVARVGAERGGLPMGSTWLATLPVFHSGGPVTLCLGSVSQLNTLVIMPPFEPGMVLKLIQQEKINWAPLVPAMLIPMIEHPDFASTDISSLKALLFGGTTLTPTFLMRAQQETGAQVQTVFGMTEGAGEIMKSSPGDSIEVVSRTVGTPLPHVDLRIVDPITNQIVAIGQTGELRYRSPYMTSGYFGDDEATTELFDAAGFLRTGDLGAIDCDGRVEITGRLKDLIIRKGENIHPREIEDVLAAYPGVAESAVIGLPHAVFGEEVAVAVRGILGSNLDVDTLRVFVADRVARYKVPSRWKIVDDFPRTAFGKIQKFAMLSLFSSESSAKERV